MLEVYGALFIIVFGTLCHFVYDWTKHNKIIGFFTAVNESTWEHLKLILAPAFIWLIVEAHVYHGNLNLFFAKFCALFAMLFIIPAIFYSYRHFTKRSILAIDILSFIIAACVGQLVFHLVINLDYTSIYFEHIGAIGTALIGLIYITQTYAPTKSFLLKDPISKKYGIDAHVDFKKKKKGSKKK